MSRDLSNRFGVRRTNRKGKPPHITLYGSFNANEEKEIDLRRLKKDFKQPFSELLFTESALLVEVQTKGL